MILTKWMNWRKMKRPRIGYLIRLKQNLKEHSSINKYGQKL
jgi:hypothetical protein